MTDRRGKNTRKLQATLARAIERHRQGRVDEAEELYQRVLGAQPQNPDALHYFGILSHQRGRTEKAIELIRRAISAQPDYLAAINNLGNVLKEHGDIPGAEAQYRKLIAQSPEYADAYNNLGVVLKSQGRHAEARDAYRRAVALAPDHADAWYNLGLNLAQHGEAHEALRSYRQAIALRPVHDEAYKELGILLHAMGRGGEAVETYREWLRRRPGNPIAEHMLAAIDGRVVPQRAADAYVTQVFDGFARSFDDELARLGYRAPELIGSAVTRVFGRPASDLRVLDAGCGTGLCGTCLRPFSRRLVGVDLSPGMLAQARPRNVYDELLAMELTQYLSTVNGDFDLIVSADTFCYFGALEPLVTAASWALEPRGWLVFTVERSSDAEAPRGYRIHPHGRYSHTKSYVLETLDAAGFSSTTAVRETLRIENGQPVAGLLVTAQRDVPSS